MNHNKKKGEQQERAVNRARTLTRITELHPSKEGLNKKAKEPFLLDAEGGQSGAGLMKRSSAISASAAN